MTSLDYQSDSYIKSFNANVTEIDEANHGLVLDATYFYPGGGGQLPDVGTLIFDSVPFPITRVKRIDGKYVHLIDKNTPLPKSLGEVVGEIDWERRYKLMRTHSAMHVLCGVVFRDYGAQVTGGNMDVLSGRMDFEFESMRQELVKEIEDAINVEVEQNRDIIVNILPRKEAFEIPDLIRTKINLLPEGITEIRTIEILGLDLQADGGTHVKNTKEIGKIKIANYKSKGKINKRIYVELLEN
jgi:misacylated tRNA(Ala) deacylase